ncbi:putative retrotransposon hot spot (RHS) protein [Trypanosoma cruzi]|uniref:Putative retrotransposon hot spot (RHS) protein n=1 Tax=Trypanosoma cruzi TaxID=5693 RepID=A0A2V2W7V3_TRYCR|nr:putative retrotransposon hot spot (RHS) protein [Trypanosoma cruzi]
MWRCCCRLHVALLRGLWASTASPTCVAVRLRGAPTTPPCECRAQRHWDCGAEQPRLFFGASGTCWPQLGGASGMLRRTGVVVVPRGGFGDGSDAAARHLAGSKGRPQLTVDGRVEDVLLDGYTPSTKMRLNDFLWSYVGSMAVAGERYNVTMEVFAQCPEMYIRDERWLRIITALPPYQELKRELDGRKRLSEARDKLEEGVFFPHRWRDFEWKDTVTSLAMGNSMQLLTWYSETWSSEKIYRIH